MRLMFCVKAEYKHRSPSNVFVSHLAPSRENKYERTPTHLSAE